MAALQTDPQIFDTARQRMLAFINSGMPGGDALMAPILQEVLKEKDIAATHSCSSHPERNVPYFYITFAFRNAGLAQLIRMYERWRVRIKEHDKQMQLRTLFELGWMQNSEISNDSFLVVTFRGIATSVQERTVLLKAFIASF